MNSMLFGRDELSKVELDIPWFLLSEVRMDH